MPQRILCKITILSTLVVVFTISALAQPVTPHVFPVTIRTDSWPVGQSAVSPHAKLDVVTINQPDRHHRCRVQSFTPDKLVCSGTFGGSRTYLPQQVIALILPGDNDLKIRLVSGFNIALGTAIWGAVVLAATCPPCAAGVSVVALMLFSGAGAVMIGDDQPERLLYLAHGQQLSRKLGYVQR